MNTLMQIRDQVLKWWSLIVGLKVTGKYFVSPQITVHYPRRTVGNLSTFHGPVELVPRPDDPRKPKCIVCLQCANSCPSNCLTVVMKPVAKPTPEEIKAQKEAEARGEKVKKSAPKELSKFTYNFTLCSLCGTCVESCPAGSLRFSSRAYLASTDKKDFYYDLLADLARRAEAGGSGSSKEEPPK